MVETGGWISYTLWYPIIHFSTLGSDNIAIVRPMIVILLTFFTVLKAMIVLWIAQRHLKSPQLGVLVAVVAVVAMPLMDPARPTHIYLGQISANVWHNSTNILVAPFAIAAFYAAIVFLRTLSIKHAAWFSGLMVICILCKPNFSVAALPVLGLAAVYFLWRKRVGIQKSLVLLVIGFLPAALVLGMQYLIVFVGDSVRETSLGIAPFAVWSAFSNNLSLSLLLSLAGPILLFVALSPAGRRRPEVVISWLILAVAIAEMSLLVERYPNGSISLEGNWTWGPYTAITMVFIFSLITFFREFPERDPLATWPRVAYFMAGLAVAGHVFSGIYYVLSVGKTMSFLGT